MAGSPVARRFLLKGGIDLRTHRLRPQTAGVATAATRWIDGAGNVTRENDACPAPLHLWVGNGPIYEQAARRTLTFHGHLSHPVGMAVHDAGDYGPDPLVPRLVISVEPQMWVPEERLYVRVEDTVVVTDEGSENLTGFVPREPGAIERLMREPGLLQAYLQVPFR
jgi:hypothetical protein